jgi:predicted RNA binding protein with dsRBD fold (UPF0201 family)
MHILVSSPVYPTEDRNRVEQGLSNLFVSSQFVQRTLGERSILATESEERASLNWLRQCVHDLRIIDATRARLTANWNGSSTILRLDKQMAFMGRARVIDDSEETPPLGCIEVQLDFEHEEAFRGFVAWFTPPTKDGRVIGT